MANPFGRVDERPEMPDLTQADLKRYFAAYPAQPPRTTALEQQIKIGTGFHNKWYRSQREHWLGWLVAKDCEAHAKGQDPAMINAKPRWQHLMCSPAMYWVAECAGVHEDRLRHAEAMAIEAARIRGKDGHPHGTMMRKALPWDVIQSAIMAGLGMASNEHAERDAMAAFDRLCEKRSEFRKLRKHLPLLDDA